MRKLSLASLLFNFALISPANALVRGKYVPTNEFRNVVTIVGNCTAAKIGEKLFLTAAHCLWIDKSKKIRPMYRKNAPLKLQVANLSTPVDVTVSKVHVHDSWKIGSNYWFVDQYDTGRKNADGTSITKQFMNLKIPQSAYYSRVYDVAVVEVNELTPNIETASVYDKKIEPRTPLVIMGSGCQDGIYAPRNYVELKAQENVAIYQSSLFHYGSFFYNDNATALQFKDGVIGLEKYITMNKHNSIGAFEKYFLTLGANFHAQFPNTAWKDYSASLCPGDSGGPVFLDTETDRKRHFVVGVNAYYTFMRDEDDALGISVVNMHTRLDGPIRVWLKSVGYVP